MSAYSGEPKASRSESAARPPKNQRSASARKRSRPAPGAAARRRRSRRLRRNSSFPRRSCGRSVGWPSALLSDRRALERRQVEVAVGGWVAEEVGHQQSEDLRSLAGRTR